MIYTGLQPGCRGNTAKRTVSVVLPVYKSAECLDELHARLLATLERLGDPFEIVFVDDACPCGSAEVLRAIAERDPRATVVTLERNSGQHRAVLAGIARSRGSSVVVMDADLQDPPEAIPRLLTRLDGRVSVVFAGKWGLYESRSRLATSRIFKRLLSSVASVPRDAGMFFAATREVADLLLAMHAPVPYVVAMIGGTGRPTVSVPVERSARPRGRSAYGGWQRLRVALSALGWAFYWRRFRVPRAGLGGTGR